MNKLNFYLTKTDDKYDATKFIEIESNNIPRIGEIVLFDDDLIYKVLNVCTVYNTDKTELFEITIREVR